MKISIALTALIEIWRFLRVAVRQDLFESRHQGRRCAKCTPMSSISSGLQSRTERQCDAFERAAMPFQPGYTPWNKDKVIGQKRPLKLEEIFTIRSQLEESDRPRELAMFNLAIDSKLRACDLIAVKIEEISAGGRVRDRATVMQRKTSSIVHFEIGTRTRVALQGWLEVIARQSGFLFPSKRYADRHLSIRQYARIVDGWVRVAGLEKSLYATHTLRRTKATILYRKTGNLRAVQLLLGHKSIENTIRYLGVEVDDALELSGQIDI